MMLLSSVSDLSREIFVGSLVGLDDARPTLKIIPTRNMQQNFRDILY